MLVKTSKKNRNGFKVNINQFQLQFDNDGVAEVEDRFRKTIETMTGSPYFLEILEEEEKEADLSELKVAELVVIAEEKGAKYLNAKGKNLTKENIIKNINNLEV